MSRIWLKPKNYYTSFSVKEPTASCASAKTGKSNVFVSRILHFGHRSVKRLAIAHTDFRRWLTGSKEIVHSRWNCFWKNVNSTLAWRNSESIIGQGSVLRQYHVFWKTLTRSCQITQISCPITLLQTTSPFNETVNFLTTSVGFVIW